MIPDDILLRLRLAMRDQIARPADGLSRAEPVIWEAACAARAANMRAEQFVILVKRAWDDIPEPGGAENSSATQRVRDQMVTRAIKAYFSEQQPAGWMPRGM